VRLEDEECLRYHIVNEADLAEGLAKVDPLEMTAADLVLLLSGVSRGARGARSLDCGLRVVGGALRSAGSGRDR
jgi:hypothetical protein